MRTIALSLTTLGTIAVILLHPAPAPAQATRTWVSGVGDDANPCSRTASCSSTMTSYKNNSINGNATDGTPLAQVNAN